MGSDHHGKVVLLEEGGEVVGAEADDVVLLLRVSHEVLSETILILALMRVAPEQVDYSLVVL